MNIGIKIVERKPIVEGSPRLICGNSGDTITFTFDSEWSNYVAKVARFVYVKNGVVVPEEVLFNGNVVEIPVLSNITEVYIGVYAGELRTTTPVTIPCDLSILCKGGEPVDPTPDIYAQILDALNAKLILEGNASSATKLETPRTIQVDLENSNGASFDGTEDVTPGVTGVLPIENGGTGANTPEGVRDNLSLDTFYAPHAVKRVNGSAVAVNDSSNSPLANLKLYGKTEQDGTPTPDNPIELKSVGDSGSFEVGVYGKNLLNNTATTQTMNGVTFTVNADKSVTVNGTATANALFHFSCLVDFRKGETITISGCANGGGNKYDLYCNFVKVSSNEMVKEVVETGNGISYTFTESGSYRISTYIRVFSGTNANNLVFKPQIEIGTVKTPYEPYKAKQTLTLTDTLRGIGDIADEKDFARGVKIQRFEKVVLNGSEAWTNNGNKQGYGVVLNNVGGDFEKPNVICDKLKPSMQNNIYEGLYNYIISTRGDYSKIYIRIDETITTVEILKQWLSNNPVTLIYPLATPIETPIPETELNAYRQLMTNKGNTTLLSEADLEVDYYTDTLSGEALGNIHSQVHNDYLKLQQAIISLVGGNTL